MSGGHQTGINYNEILAIYCAAYGKENFFSLVFNCQLYDTRYCTYNQIQNFKQLFSIFFVKPRGFQQIPSLFCLNYAKWSENFKIIIKGGISKHILLHFAWPGSQLKHFNSHSSSEHFEWKS